MSLRQKEKEGGRQGKEGREEERRREGENKRNEKRREGRKRRKKEDVIGCNYSIECSYHQAIIT